MDIFLDTHKNFKNKKTYMKKNSIKNEIEELFPYLEKPSRYLGNEINSVQKDENVKLNFLLAYPEIYEIGMSHFGIQILYNILNEQDDVYAQRVFTPPLDLEKLLREKNLPLFSLETKKDMKSFDIIGFSLLYELNYTNILLMLDLAKIPFFSNKRDENYPIIIAGGPTCFNPEPIADFFDAIVIGDGEEVVQELSRTYIMYKNEGKQKVLKQFAKIRGVYVPALFETFSQKAKQTKIKKALIKKFDEKFINIKQIVPYGRPVHDKLRIEICRGCSSGCRFCQAGMIYRPVREKKVADILYYIKKAISETGYNDLSLLSLSTGDYTNLSFLIDNIINNLEEDNVSVSLPSIRADKLNEDVMSYIKSARKTGFTIAPEAGSQRLRDVINKKLTEEDILKTAQNAFSFGWKVLKLYFMIGLPTETMEDIEEIVKLVKKLKNFKRKINLSITIFVPKSHTPFQYEAFIKKEEALKKILYLKQELKGTPLLKINYIDPNLSELEAIISKGDRKISNLIFKAYQNGAKFDAWSDKFDYTIWESAIKESNLDISYIYKKRSEKEAFPWAHIDSLISEEFLLREREIGLKEELSDNCIYGKCGNCGICDFKEVKPILFKKEEKTYKKKTKQTVEYEKKVFKFTKEKNSRFFGHLELINIFLKHFKIAGVNLKYSEGFHPLPEIMFFDTLPLGMESLSEKFYCQIDKKNDFKNLIKKMNNTLPEGLQIVSCKKIEKKRDIKMPECDIYSVISKDSFDTQKLENFKKAHSFFIKKRNKKGVTKDIDIKNNVLEIKLKTKNTLYMLTKNRLRPTTILKNVFGLSDDNIKRIRVIKINSLNSLDENYEDRP